MRWILAIKLFEGNVWEEIWQLKPERGRLFAEGLNRIAGAVLTILRSQASPLDSQELHATRSYASTAPAQRSVRRCLLI